jgi:hypothetical protein
MTPNIPKLTCISTNIMGYYIVTYFVKSSYSILSNNFLYGINGTVVKLAIPNLNL